MSKVAVLQMASSPSITENLNQVCFFLAKAREDNCDLVVLPENFAFIGKKSDKLHHAEYYGAGPIQDYIKSLAKKYNLWIIAGTLLLKGFTPRARASCLVIDNKGSCVARYDKIHLFDVSLSEQEKYQESALLERGKDIVVVATPVGKIGLTVCYDLRFPELYQQLLIRGAELFTVVSAFTRTTGSAHWEVLIRARAIETLSYVLAPNQEGEHKYSHSTYGHSIIVDPWGKILAQQEKGVGLISVEIDLPGLHELRRQFPCNTHHVITI